MLPAPDDSSRVVLLLSGWREQGVQVVSRSSGRVLQTVPQAAAFLGLAFSPDGRTLYASGGNQDVVYRYAWRRGRATLADSLVLAAKAPDRPGTRYPAGLALSADGRTLYVAENLADSLAVVDLASGRVTARHPVGRYPYGVVVTPAGTVFVSNWGANTVSVFAAADSGRALVRRPAVEAGRHPSAMRLSPDGTRLFVASGSTDRVAVLDARTLRRVGELRDPPAAAAAAGAPVPNEGSTPNALELSADGRRLFVAEADNNAVAVFELSAATSGVSDAAGDDRLVGRVPTGWYPTAVLALGDTLVVANGKGRGTGANPGGPQPGVSRERRATDRASTLGQISGTLSVVRAVRAGGAELDALSARVARANGWGRRVTSDERRVGADSSPVTRHYPPFQHVIYVIKENRTYDQILGDLPQGDGDTSLVFFPRPVSPNHHALAERFGLFDRFFVNAEVSPDGHNWSTAAYTTDYLQKTVPSNYSGRGRTYDYEGTNRGSREKDVPEDDVSEPAEGYLWDLAERAKISFRNYGEFVVPVGADADELPEGYRGSKPFLRANTNERFPGYDLAIPDQRRADVWLAEFAEYVRRGTLPRLMIVRLPNDHTAGARAGAPTPRAMMADNDLALGRMVEALSRSPFWRSTVMFVLEDDAQNGPDHVDSHRSPLLVISPYNRPAVHHRFANTTDVLATMEEILGLDALSQFDWYGRPLREVFAATPDLAPYQALTPAVRLDEMNPRTGRGASASAKLDLSIEDVADEDAFNRVLWEAIKGPGVPYPGPRRMGGLEMKRGM
jgi:YVTN family beta-propeller protein